MARAFRLVFAATACIGISSAAVAASNTMFLKNALMGDNSEIQLGQMAQKSGATEGVRTFGQTLSTDHAKAKTNALPVAKAHGVAATMAVKPEAQTEMDKLSKLSGATFDHEFVSYMVMDHKKDIADFEKQARTGDRSTAALAKKTLPDLKKHLAMAQKLMR